MSEQKQHEMRDDPTGEADAVCTCGAWRLLGIGTTPEAEPADLKQARIIEQFNRHLAATQGTRGGQTDGN